MKVDRTKLQKSLEARTAKIWGTLSEMYPELCRLDPPKIVLSNRLYRSAGYCMQEERVVTIAAKFYDAGYAAKMDCIILPHEVIHQADYDLFGKSNVRCGHGESWALLMTQYGLEPDKYHTMNINARGEKV